jgi:hypothetical protein
MICSLRHRSPRQVRCHYGPQCRRRLRRVARWHMKGAQPHLTTLCVGLFPKRFRFFTTQGESLFSRHARELINFLDDWLSAGGNTEIAGSDHARDRGPHGPGRATTHTRGCRRKAAWRKETAPLARVSKSCGLRRRTNRIRFHRAGASIRVDSADQLRGLARTRQITPCSTSISFASRASATSAITCSG